MAESATAEQGREARHLIAQIARLTRTNPYDELLPALREQLADVQYRQDRDRVEALAAEVAALSPAEIREVAVIARKIDRRRKQQVSV